jgi:glycosyltransferase involved in cell wall biosynthesis
MPLRIAHITNEPIGVEIASGIQQVVSCLARAQAEMGHVVAVFSRDDHAVNVLGNNGAPLRSALTAGESAGASVRRRLLSRHSEWPSVEDVLAWQPDVVHFHSVHILQNVALAADLVRANTPYCVTIHGALFPEALRRGWLKKKFFHLAFERRYLNEARFIQALGPRERATIRAYGLTAPIIEVPNGLPADIHLRPSRPDALWAQHPALRGCRVFMFLGRLDPCQKGLDLLIDGFAHARLRDAALVLVGPDFRGSRRSLSDRAERRGIRSRVVFVEPVYGHDRANCLAAADVFVHPSRWEGLSMSVLAASAAGKPSLVTPAADPLGQLQRADAAIVVKPTVSSIADGLNRAATFTRGELQAMGARARNVLETHITWPQVARKVVAAYQRALGDERRRRPSRG